MEKVQIISAVIVLLGALYIIRLIRKRKIDLKYALPWMFVAFLILLVDCFPGILSGLSKVLGIATPVNTLFLVALCFATSLIFVMTVVMSRQSDRIRQLAQAVALNEEKIRELTEVLEKQIKEEQQNNQE